MRRLAAAPLAFALAAVLAGLGARGALAQEEPESCLECHSAGATKEGAPQGDRFDPAPWGRSVHRKSCVQCHEDMEEVPHPKKEADPVNCANCHEDAVQKFAQTPHGKLPSEGPSKAPVCADCHPPHAVIQAKDPASNVHKGNLLETCGQCHAGERGRGEHAGAPKTVADYAASVHGLEVLREHNEKAPACTDCHPVHEMRLGTDPTSKTFKPNVPKLCGTCHAEISKQYAASVHGTALALGRIESPACTDCHSEHSIQRPTSPDSTVYATHVSQTCASCHASERITRKYGLDADRVASYRDSYHGLADLGGSMTAANCASCHGFHDVLPSADPSSRIHRDNLLKTCQTCHPAAGAKFIEGRVHAAADPEQDTAAYWVRLIYLWLIPATIGGMLLHNAVIFFKHVLDKYRAHRASTTYVRFRTAEVWVHALTALSFILLALTGFALAFPTAAWARWLASIGMDETVRSWIHRGAAVLFAATSLWHVVYVLATRHGRYGLGRIFPRAQDVRDVTANMAWHLGLRRDRPRFDRFDYTMKVEYWALVWGGFVMSATGGLLWFKEEVSVAVPRWVVYVAERVHYYEAILAVLAIIVWHFFFVIFHPDEYPMNLTWITGRKTEHEMEHAHPVELERLKDSEYKVPPLDEGEEPTPRGGGHA